MMTPLPFPVGAGLQVPLTPLQEAMLQSTLANSRPGSNVEQVEITFGESVSMDAVREAWQATVRHADVLRCGFHFVGGERGRLAEIQGEMPVRVAAENPHCWQTWLDEDRGDPFPLDGGFPWRITLWPSAGKMVWTFHHALLDGRSITKILRLFRDLLEGNPCEERLGLASREAAGPAAIAAAGEYYRRTLANLEPVEMEFPGDAPEAPKRLRTSLGGDTARALQATSERHEITVPTLVTWAWGQAMALASGNGAVAVGQVRSGPPMPGCAGFTMSTVPLVISRASDRPLRETLRAFRADLLALREVENVPPGALPPEIFAKAGGPWSAGLIMVERGSLQHQVGPSRALRSIVLHESSGEPLLASAWIEPDLTLEIEVNGRPYGETAAKTLLDLWAHVINTLANACPAIARDAVSLPDEPIEKLSKWEWGGEQAAHESLPRAWARAVEHHAHRCAILTRDREILYSQLHVRVESLAAKLLTEGVLPGARIGSMLWNREHLSVALLAIARVGAINVPLDVGLPEKRLAAILADAGCDIVITDRPDSCARLAGRPLCMEDIPTQVCQAPVPSDPRAPLSILYTSGSTGVPKGVLMVHGGVTNEALAMAELAGITPGDRILQFASPGFDACLEELLMTLLSGATLVPRPDALVTDLREFHRFISHSGITVLDLSTAHWSAWCAWMISEAEQVPSNLRTVIIGGERASAATMQDWFAAGGEGHRLINTYGPTEASIVGTAEVLEGPGTRGADPPIGRPLRGVHARIADPAGNRLPPGLAGELWLGGIAVGAGYWRREDLTAESFREIDGIRWYRTGDRVHWDGDGRLRFLGRQDDQLKIRGNRIEPNEVIRVLEEYPGVSAAHAGPVDGPDGAKLLAAWIRWTGTAPQGWPALVATHAAAHLPQAAIPTRWAEVTEFRLTERGKLDRKQLPEPLLTSSSANQSEPPATPTERELALIWSKLLGVASIGRDESFFELGGHSLVALQLFARINKRWHKTIPMASLMQAPTLRLLATIIDDNGNEGSKDLQTPLIHPVRAGGDLPPLFCIHGGDGGVLFYSNLAQRLPEGRPLLAIESPFLGSVDEIRVRSIEETASRYLAAIRERQQHGPYHIAGYSYGGILAYELVRQLLEREETVAFVGIFDTVNPALDLRAYSLTERLRVFWKSQQHRTLASRIASVVERTREGIATHLEVKRQVRAAATGGISDPYSHLRMLQIREAHWKSLIRYQPEPVDCHLTLFRSEATDDKFEVPYDYGWSSLVSSLDIVEVPGKHLTIFSSAHADALAKEVARRLPVPAAENSGAG